MVQNVYSKVLGVPQLERAMQDLPVQIQNRCLNAGMRAGGVVVQQAAKKNLKGVTASKTSTGFLLKNIIVKKVKANRGMVRYVVAIRGGVVNPKNGERPGLYGSVLEHGKENQPPQPWLRPAVKTETTKVVERIRQVGMRTLAKAVQAARKKGRTL